jgi:nucleotide-binding universal stress UspA family protein
MPETTLLICYDGSDFAKRAIVQAPALLAIRDAIVLAVWQPTVIASLAWAGGGSLGSADFAAVDQVAEAAAQRVADEGAGLAIDAGFDARAETAEARGPIWDAIVTFARQREVSAIVVGSRGLTGLKSVLLGSVSEGIIRHAHRTTVVVQDPSFEAHAEEAA